MTIIFDQNENMFVLRLFYTRKISKSSSGPSSSVEVLRGALTGIGPRDQMRFSKAS